MPPRLLMAGITWRKLAAGALVASTAWLAMTQAYQAAGAPQRSMARVLGGDPAVIRQRMIATPAGLALRLDEGQRVALRRALTADPLDGTTITLAALDRASRGDAAGATALARHALRADPRTQLAWLALLNRQMGGGGVVAAAASVLRLLAIDPRRSATYLPVLATLARDRRTTRLIASAVQQAPNWRPQFFERLALDKVDPAIRYALVNPAGRRAMPGAGRDDTAFVANLVADGDVDRAYLAWLSLLPDGALQRVGTPYDPGFDGMPGAAPFNWQLSESAADRAMFSGGALEISYSGRQTAVLASQVVLLGATARYRLVSVAAATGQPADDGSTLAWRVFCLPRYDLIGELRLDPSIAAPQRSDPFTVPAQQCDAVSLALVGTAEDVPVRVTARLSSIALERLADPAEAPPAVSVAAGSRMAVQP